MFSRRMEKLFWGHPTKKNTTAVTLYLRITVDGQRAELGSTGIQILKKHWNSEAQRITAKTAEAAQQNHTLDILRERAQAIYNELLLKGAPFTANNIKQLFRQEGRGFTFVSLFSTYLQQLRRDPEIADSTWSTYDVVRKKITVWLTDVLKQPDLPGENFSKGTLERYRTWMRLDDLKAPNTIRKHTSTIKQVLTWAYLNDYTSRDPLQGYRVPSVKAAPPTFLTIDELITLIKHPFEGVLAEIRDQFLITCFSGLAYADLRGLRSEHMGLKTIQTHEDLAPVTLQWLEKARQKTAIKARQPLHPIVEAILIRYGSPDKMHIRPNQKMNHYLKLIGLHTQLTKVLKTHVGRKTFANLCLNGGLYAEQFADVCPAVLNFQNSKFSTESTLAMMGRTSAKGLDAYATPGEQSIMLELKVQSSASAVALKTAAN